MFFPRAHAGGLPPPLHPPPGGKAPGPPGRFAPVRHPGSIHESSWLDYNVFWTAVPPLGHGHVDHPSNQASVRPTVRRPGLPTYKTSIVLTATIFTLFKATTKVAACGRHLKRGDATFGRATSFVVSFVVVVNRVNIVAVNTILVLHLGKTGRSVGRTDFGLDGWSAGLGCPMDGRQDGRTNAWSGGLGNARRCSAVLYGTLI